MQISKFSMIYLFFSVQKIEIWEIMKLTSFQVIPCYLQRVLREEKDQDKAWINSKSQVNFGVYLIYKIRFISKNSNKYFEELMSSLEQKGNILMSFLLICFNPFSSASLTFYRIDLTAFQLSYPPSSISISPSLYFLPEIPEFFLNLIISLLASSIILEHI